MKVVFWGEEAECGTTSNLMALAGYIGCHSKYRVAMLQTEGRKQNIREHFSGKIPELAKEKNEYYALEGLDYLLSVGRKRKLNTRIVMENLDAIIDRHLYCLSQGTRMLSEVYLEETYDVLHQIIECLDKGVDFTFVDCGKRVDEWAQTLLKEADLVVVNLRQATVAFDSFFMGNIRLSSNCIYLVSSYQKESVYNIKNLQQIYRIPEKQLVVVPYNPEFQMACEKGRLDKYMQGKGKFYVSETRRYFMQELETILQRLVEVRKDGK